MTESESSHFHAMLGAPATRGSHTQTVMSIPAVQPSLLPAFPYTHP